MSAQLTMYETIMNLPLFHGVSKEHISAFLEKTRIEFQNYEKGEEIIRSDAPVKHLKFIISGRVEVTTLIYGGKARVITDAGETQAFGVSGLFGLTPRYMVGVMAMERVSIMQFSKDAYIELLKSDSIYLLNYANYLSHRVQKYENLLRRMPGFGVLGVLQALLTAFSIRECRHIQIEFDTRASFESYFPEAAQRELREMEDRGLILLEDYKIIILSRSGILR